MPDPWVELLGFVEDVHGARFVIGVDHDGVRVGGRTFSREQREHMDRLLSEAWEKAAENGERMGMGGAADDGV